MNRLSERAQQLKPSPTLALAAKAKELIALGHDVISLTVGEPDWDTFSSIKKIAISEIESGNTKYTSANGIPELRQAIAQQTAEFLEVSYKSQNVVVTAGGKMAIFAALQCLCNTGDEIIIPAPYWVSYPTMVELAGGTPVIAETSAQNRFKMTAQQLSALITNRTKMLILNSPSNPTGNMYSRDELKEIADVLRCHPHVMVMSDDIYNQLVFNGATIAPHLLHVAPDLKSRTILINGASKTYSMTGWRLGWLLAEPQVAEAVTNYLSQSVSCAAPFTQRAMVYGLLEGQGEVAEAVTKLRMRAEQAFSLLETVPGLKVDKPDGAFYFWPSIQYFIGKSYRGRRISNSREFAEALLEGERLAVVPGVEFGQEGYVRMSFVISDARWEEAIKRMKRWVEELT